MTADRAADARTVSLAMDAPARVEDGCMQQLERRTQLEFTWVRQRGFAASEQWLRATRDAIAFCECAAGCPSCVQSSKCGNGNNPLDEAGAVALLDRVLAEAVADEGTSDGADSERTKLAATG